MHIGLSRPSIGPFGSWHAPRLPNLVNRSEREAPEVVPGDAEDVETRTALPAREAQLPLALRGSPPYRIRPALPGPPRPRVLGGSGPRRLGVVRRRGLNVGGPERIRTPDCGAPAAIVGPSEGRLGPEALCRG